MSLLCRLGRHRPRGIPRWNDGLYFARCARCGRDLVRTAFEGWHVPKGYRVVWSDRPPADRPEVALVAKEIRRAPDDRAQEPAAAPAARASGPEAGTDPPEARAPSSPAQTPKSVPIVAEVPVPDRTPAPPDLSQGGRLPIQEVLAHLKAEESARRVEEKPRAPAEAPLRTRPSTWDFMDDDPVQDRPVSAPEGQAAATAPAEPIASVDPTAETPSRNTAGLGGRRRNLGSVLRDFRSGPGEPKPPLVAALALAVVAAVALALYSAGYPAPGLLPDRSLSPAPPGGGDDGAGTAGKADPFAASAPYVSSGDAGATQGQEAAGGPASAQIAYVSASLLVCRSAPDPQASRVRNLARGREVRVLGYDGAWASVAYRGAQCWAQAQYLSPVAPL